MSVFDILREKLNKLRHEENCHLDMIWNTAVDACLIEINQVEKEHSKNFSDCENNFSSKKQTNADCIRAMSDEELTKIIMCPYDTAGEPEEIMPCIIDGNTQGLVSPEFCKQCIMNWLRKEV